MKYQSKLSLHDLINQQHQDYGICCDCVFFNLCTEYQNDHCEEYINFFQKALDPSAKGLIKDVDGHDPF